MVAIERRCRKGPVLTPSSLPCLRDMPTINITEGCAHGCVYCYTQGYKNYPGAGRVVLFANTPDLVRTELACRRRRPRRVYFSPSSDAFQPLPEVLETTYQTMAALLAAGVEVAFLTKGIVDERFVGLFSKSPAMVFAQIGMTTLDERAWKAFEAGAASPSQRLHNIDELVSIGVATEARLDPLIPDVTDVEGNLSSLLGELERRRVRGIAASYLFLRTAFARGLSEPLRRVAGSSVSTDSWSQMHLADGVGDGRMAGLEMRRRGFARLDALAARHGIKVRVCACKNPDLVSNRCQIAGPDRQVAEAETKSLFDRV